jgi:hypothetical protein
MILIMMTAMNDAAFVTSPQRREQSSGTATQAMSCQLHGIVGKRMSHSLHFVSQGPIEPMRSMYQALMPFLYNIPYHFHHHHCHLSMIMMIEIIPYPDANAS